MGSCGEMESRRASASVGPRKLRVALFSGNYNYVREGANQALNLLVRHLEEEAGHTVRVYSPVTSTPAFEPAGTLVPVPSVALPIRSEFRLALGLPAAIRRDVIAFRPDLIHVSTPDFLNVRAQTLGKRLRVPVVASLHTCFERYLAYYGLGWTRPAIEAHLRRFYRRSDHVLAPTPSLVATMAETLGEDRVSLWSRGVDHELFNPIRRNEGWRRQQGWSPDDVVVLFLGRLVLEKGVEAFVSIVRDLQSRDSRICPLVIGAGPAEAPFRTLKRVRITGHLQQGELATAVANADIMLNPSTTEAFGNVVLEAMASGVAVVSADVPSARALIDDGRTGILCPAHGRKNFHEVIAELVASPDSRDRLGREACSESKRYSWAAASESVDRTYHALLERTSAQDRRGPAPQPRLHARRTPSRVMTVLEADRRRVPTHSPHSPSELQPSDEGGLPSCGGTTQHWPV